MRMRVDFQITIPIPGVGSIGSSTVRVDCVGGTVRDALILPFS